VTDPFQFDELEYQREEQLILADALSELQLEQAINDALHSATLTSVVSLYNQLVAAQEAGDYLPVHIYRDLMAAIDKIREDKDMN